MEAIHAPMLTPLSLADLCAHYLCDRFQFNLNVRSSDLIDIATISQFLPLMLLPLTSELDRIAIALADAFLNHGKYICETPLTYILR